jgi:hypothetical protein
MSGQNIGEAPDFVEGVIERCRRDADDVRFAKIAFHISESGSVSEVRRPPSAFFLLASPSPLSRDRSTGLSFARRGPGEKQTDDDENGIWPMF